MRKHYKILKLFRFTLIAIPLLGAIVVYKSNILLSDSDLSLKDQITLYGDKSLEAIENMPKYDRPDLAMFQDFEMTKDPALNDVPRERTLKVFESMKTKGFTARAIQGVNWDERGPNNVGGRTRTLMFDPNDATNRKVWAGSVGGGLWFNNDITNANSQWQSLDNFWANLAITTIVHDPSNTQEFYAGTGEGFFNGGAVRGAGIWKSSNGGTSWTQLANTNNSDFHYITKLGVTSAGTILAATRTGLFRSTNGGSTWTATLTGSRFADIEIASNGSIYVSEGLFQAGTLHKSTNDGVSFTTVTPPATGGERIEIETSESSPNTVYAIASNDSNNIAWFRKSTNGGSSWTTLTVPKYVEQGSCSAGSQDFTRGQSWYDLILAVSPINPNLVLVGGIDVHRSTNGGSSWSSVSYWTPNCSRPNVHADQHEITFRPGSPNEAIFGNDGGVYYSNNVGNSGVTPGFSARNNSYNVTQFYAADQENTSGDNSMLAGAQDNGTQRFQSAGIGSTSEATGGDGAFCHIDQDNSNYQLTAYVYNSIYRSTNGGNSFSRFINNTSVGRFINPSDYDDAANILYAAAGNNQYYRHSGITGSISSNVITATLGGFKASAFKASPYTANRVFIGTGTDRGAGGSKIFRIDNANGSPSSTEIGTASIPADGYISSIDVGSSDNQLILTLSNYGVISVWETRNGGISWVNREGNLPDIPIRWALYNPNNTDEVLLATELGVWSTEDVNVASPDWGVTNTGLANVRTDMLQYRSSDGQVIVATHGRGVYTGKPFSASTGDTQAPSTPTNLTTSNVTTNSFDASWTASTDNVGVTNYTVSLNGSVDGTTASTSYSFTGLTASTSYTVSVVANDAAGNNSGSASANITTSAANQPCTGGITAFPYSEGFESGIGAWTQATGDDGNWLRLNGSTPSSSTGPTSASEGSNYLYLEASTSGTGQIGSNATAILESPCFDLSSESSADFNFKYHMWGGNMGTLRLEASTNGGSSYTEIWSRTGDQGNAWLSGAVSLNAYAGGTVSLRFRGTTGNGWQSDISIDDLELTGGATADTQAPTVPTSLTASNVAETTLTLNWNASTDNVAVTGYDVYQGATNLGTVATTSSNVTGLTANTAYSFTVRAKDVAGNESAASIAVNVTTLSVNTGCTGGIASFPYNEGLESGSGGWTQATGDDGNWLSLNGSTPSNSTGPTSASQGSNYLYLEASTSGAGQIGSNATAILESPCINLSSLSTANFNFKYHMWGGNMGTLRVEASTDDGATYTEIWSRVGDQGNAWLTGTTSLASYVGGNVNIRFRGTTGNGWQSDISIDDISITSGSVSTIPCTLTVSSFPYNESFESGAGTFVQASGDDGDWVNDASGTPSNGTGPSSATDGSFYMFLEASSNTSAGQIGSNATAILESPCFDLSGQSTSNFNFSYHMLGTNMGSLVLEATTDGTTWTNIWSKSGDQGGAWLNASVSLSTYLGGTVKLRFNGTTGNGWSSDMAIDNINVGSTATTSAFSTNPFSDFVDEQEAAKFQIFPNPMTDELNVRMKGLSGRYEIISLSGQVLKIGAFSDEQRIDVSQLIPGHYVIKVTGEEDTFIEKVLKK